MKRLLLMLAGLAALTASMVPDAHAGQLRKDVGPNGNATYEKECGGCHMAYQAGWLPDRSWRQLMGSLDKHFGESLALPAGKQAEILKHLTDNSADRMQSLRSVLVLQSLREGEPTPLAITRVPLVSGIHAGRLDPAFDPKPAPKTIANCTTCHSRAAQGSFSQVEFTVSDASFRSTVPALAVGLTPDEKLIPQAK
jgi:cytochrome c553